MSQSADEWRILLNEEPANEFAVLNGVPVPYISACATIVAVIVPAGREGNGLGAYLVEPAERLVVGDAWIDEPGAVGRFSGFDALSDVAGEVQYVVDSLSELGWFDRSSDDDARTGVLCLAPLILSRFVAVSRLSATCRSLLLQALSMLH